jgi:hypothetical protein
MALTLLIRAAVQEFDSTHVVCSTIPAHSLVTAGVPYLPTAAGLRSLFPSRHWARLAWSFSPRSAYFGFFLVFAGMEGRGANRPLRDRSTQPQSESTLMLLATAVIALAFAFAPVQGGLLTLGWCF